MARALRLAERGLFGTDPNPRVGCVLTRDGRIIGEGWHVKAGQGHAEVEALRAADAAEVVGCTAYVTLEPCCHHGKTPPCSAALIAAGVRRTVVAMADPNPLVAGKGLQQLAEAGIEVVCGVLEEQAERLNRGFCLRMREGRPWIFSKLAMSLDGRTAMASGESRWITGTAARHDVQRLRARSSAILTGVATVLADDPSLTVRLQGEGLERQPQRLIVDSTLRTPPEARMGQLAGVTRILTCSGDHQRRARLEGAGFQIETFPADSEGRIDLKTLPGRLAEWGFNEVMVEAGPTFNGALLAAGLVDELWVYMAPCVLGDAARGLFRLPGLETMAQRIELKLEDVRQVGADLRLRYAVSKLRSE